MRFLDAFNEPWEQEEITRQVVVGLIIGVIVYVIIKKVKP